eukprot:3874217-Lingulodinium_polyedra.AAC.1
MRRRREPCSWSEVGRPASSSQGRGGTWGRQGLMGQQSVLFYATPAVAGVASEPRPDLCSVRERRVHEARAPCGHAGCFGDGGGQRSDEHCRGRRGGM